LSRLQESMFGAAIHTFAQPAVANRQSAIGIRQ
jgi:hypothetical protein